MENVFVFLISFAIGSYLAFSTYKTRDTLSLYSLMSGYGAAAAAFIVGILYLLKLFNIIK